MWTLASSRGMRRRNRRVAAVPTGHHGSMTCRISAIAIDATDPRLVAEFWCDVLGWRITDEDDDGVCIGAPDGSWPTIDFFPVPEKKSLKNRVHLDLRADGTTQAEELDRLLALGATRVDVGQGEDATWVVLGDPEGNEFCLLLRNVEEARAARA